MGKKHTPGPWYWSGEYALYGANKSCVMAALDGATYSEYSSDPASIEIPNDADRALILAAPEMLAALEGVYARCCGEYPDHPETKAVAAAIAKAMGEAP